MAGFVPPSHPAAPVPGRPVSHLVFVPVDGRLVFCFCVLVGIACVVWFVVLCKRGMQEERDQ